MTAIFLVVATALPALLCWLRIRWYRRWFRGAPHRDEVIDCSGCRFALDLRVEKNRIEIPADLDLRAHTVLLHIEVESTLIGQLRDPSLQFDNGDDRYCQHFERGAKGYRYVNLSLLFPQGAPPRTSPVRLRGRSIRLNRNAKLVAFAPPARENTTALIVSPHPDDAEIAAFGLYASQSSWVLTITPGEKSIAETSANVSATSNAARTARLRLLDSLSTPALGRVPVERRANLVYPDGRLEAMYRQPTQPQRLGCEPTATRAHLRAENSIARIRSGGSDCTWNDLIEELKYFLLSSRPTFVVCPHPVLDAHPDHVFTTIAVAEASRQLDQHPVFFLYVNHNRLTPLAPFGPRESVVAPTATGKGTFVGDSVYSLTLGRDLQTAKYAALDSMHSTRNHSAAQAGRSSAILRTIAHRTLAIIAGIPYEPASWLRRAPRPNELFYVARFDQLQAMIEQAIGLFEKRSAPFDLDGQRRNERSLPADKTAY